MKTASGKTTGTSHGHQAELSGHGGGGRLLSLWPVALIVVATCLVYIPVMNAGYIWDDGLYLTENPLIKAPDGWLRVWYDKSQVTYYPLTSDVFWLEWRLWGDKPGPYHVVNILLHALAAVLVWRVLLRLKVPGAVAAAMIFAVHPVAVETVAWITELKNTLPMVFSLLFFLAWLRFDDSCHTAGETPARRMGETPMPPPMAHGHWKWYGLSLLAFLAALLSKTSVVALPLTLPLLAWWRHRRITPKDLLLVLPYLPLSLGLGVVTMWFENKYQVYDIVVRPEGLASRIAASGWIVWFYLSKLVLPINLNVMYPRWDVDGGNVLSYVPLALFVAVFVVFFLYRRTWGRGPLVALGFFVIALLPVLGFADIGYFRFSLVADHFQYTPMVAIIALLVGVVAAAMASRQSLAALRVPLAGAVVIVLGILSYRHAGMFHDAPMLWRITAEKNDKAWVAWNNLGGLALDDRAPQQALVHFDRSINLQPDYFLAYYNRANAYRMLRQLPEAVSDCDAAIRLQPKHAQSYLLRAQCFMEMGQREPALQDYTKAIELQPGYVLAYINRAGCLYLLHHYDQAWEDLQMCRKYGVTAPPELVQKVAHAMGRSSR